MSKLRQKFKRILKGDQAKLRDICIFISEYFKDIKFIPMSPVDIGNKSEPSQLYKNFFLARAHFAKKFNIRLNLKNAEKPKNGSFWTDYDWNVYKFDIQTKEWIHITTPIHPGKDIFEPNENKTSETKDLYEQIQELENRAKKAEEN